ncbi:hypothetical protein BDA96_07G088000 [Sorghum bicolor]|uniref:Uncharacterized protein n=2 Tax=Sorghum bicolor TaxID=4558 RepID=A0A921QJG6_SORBI|nr:hypothetical protein BDA96_07G088000 [Sorghum bicolor]KXG24775.1 hypothetical protein SORBI_3007G084400 [Sorghum bicolor]
MLAARSVESAPGPRVGLVAKSGIPDELEPLVRERAIREGLVGQRLLEKGAVAELVPQEALHVHRGLGAVGDEARH